MAGTGTTGGAAKSAGSVEAKVVKDGQDEGLERFNATGGIALWATARYEGDNLNVSIAGSAPYGRHARTATAAVDVPADDEALERVRKAMDKLLDRYRDDVAAKATQAAARAYVYAIDKGEE
jgi:hypothetical protein